MPKKKPVKSTQSGIITNDAFQNLMARIGFGSTNLSEGAQYPLTRLTREYNLMNALYRNNWIARRVVDIIPKDAIKNGWKYQSEIDPEETDMLHKMERLTRLKPQLQKSLCWGRLYGGAVALMLLDGQEDELDQPLDHDSIMPGDYQGLLILDRWSGVYPELQLITDINDPEFGLPEMYRIQDYTNKNSYLVHHSRLLRFIGCDLPEWEKQAETYWGSSVIENCYEEIKKRDNTSANIAGLIFLSNLRVLKMNDLGELKAGAPVGTNQDIYNTMQAQSWLQSNFGTYIISKDDDFQTFSANFSGLNELYESFMMDVSGAAQIPVTKLFGRSPAGMNATGESDMRNYYDVVENEQESALRPALEKLLPVICMSTLGYIPDDIEIAFNPVYSPTDEEIGNTVKYKMEALLGAYDRDIISQEIVLEEMTDMTESTGLWSNITDEFIAKADKETGKLDLMGEEGGYGLKSPTAKPKGDE